ncbi:MAG: transcriptional regulator [Verrucomicrobiales bacterium]|nr:transcriptional regulator [Verrucomicrobiales bacterium]|tara:strand:+ start:4518 stop:4982 length:465 start_codon:yes stop_codon:yes gene_type:complete
MKLSQRGEYAVQALLVLGICYGPEVIRIKDIAKQQNIPRRFLEQILNDLKSGGFVQSRRGVAGGYRLERSPEQILLSEIIQYIEGPIESIDSSNVGGNNHNLHSDEAAKCAINFVMKDVRSAIVGVLESVTLSDLCKRLHEIQGSMENPPDYSI